MEQQRHRAAVTGLIAGLAATTMLFAAFTSAYIVRRGVSGDWVQLSLPPVVYASLLPSIGISVALQVARRRATAGILLGSAALGVLFAAMHAQAWRELGQSSAAAFFFVISGAFLVFVTGGVLALVYAAWKRSPLALKMISYYWLYLNALWIYLLVFLSFWN